MFSSVRAFLGADQRHAGKRCRRCPDQGLEVNDLVGTHPPRLGQEGFVLQRVLADGVELHAGADQLRASLSLVTIRTSCPASTARRARVAKMSSASQPSSSGPAIRTGHHFPRSSRSGKPGRPASRPGSPCIWDTSRCGCPCPGESMAKKVEGRWSRSKLITSGGNRRRRWSVARPVRSWRQAVKNLEDQGEHVENVDRIAHRRSFTPPVGPEKSPKPVTGKGVRRGFLDSTLPPPRIQRQGVGILSMLR
ncbi:MAG: hypothetical protein Ct9H300mP1_04420 [Planctomycetaceae bacterium]|nr:MAG: hypothetical protein Ct9H300mP1_04420 [Planctomycetaceae bacterium]